MNLDPSTVSPAPAPPPGNAVVPSTAVRAHARLIASVRRQQRNALWTEGFLWGAFAMVVLFLVAGVVALLSPALGRGLVFAALPVGLALFVGRGPWRARRLVGDDSRTARLLGERLPDLSLDLLAALELERELPRTPDFSPELARAFLDQIDARAQAIDPRQVVDRGGVHDASLALTAAALLLALAVIFRPFGIFRALPRAATPTAAKTEKPKEPITGDIELTYRYPAYTGLSMKVLPNTTGEIAAPAGTEVTLRTRADRPVEHAFAVVNGQKVPLVVQGGRELTGRLVLQKGGSYHFLYESAKGKSVAEGPDTSITVTPDSPPKVDLLSPAEQIEVSPKQTVTLQYEAEDDYGLTALALVYKLPGEDKPHRVPLRHDVGRHSAGRYVWDIDALALPPGARVSYQLEATDNDEVSGKQTGVSRTHVLRIYSAEEHRRAALQKAEALWNRLIDQLGDRMEGPDRRVSKDEKTVEAQGALDDQGEKLAEDFIEASRTLAKDKAVPPALLGALLNVGDGLRTHVRLTREARRLFERLSLRYPELHAGQRVTRAVDAEIAEEEKDVLYLESLLDKEKLSELQALSRELASDRRDLAKLIEQFQQTKSPALQKEILAKVGALRERIMDLMRRMAELSKGIRDEHLNTEALQKLAKNEDLLGTLDKVQKLMREGKTEEALKLLQQMGMQLDQLSQQLGDASQKAGSDQFSQVRKELSEFMQKLSQTAQAQQELAEKTREVRDRYRKQQLEKLKKEAGALQKQLLDQVEALQKDYQKIPPGHRQNGESEAFNQLKSELENLKNAIKQQAFDLAIESADSAEMEAGALAAYAGREAQLDQMLQDVDHAKDSRKRADQLASDDQKMRRIQQQLHQLFQSPSSMMSKADQQKVQKMAEQQRQLQQQAEQLQQQLQQIAQQAPVIGQRGQDTLQSVGDQMAQAGAQLQGKDPSRGYSHQQSAMDGLKQLQQQMKSGKGSSGAGGLPLPMMAGEEGGGQGEGGLDSQEKVEIPDVQPNESTREFRKDLMDAMKQGVPEKYRQQVKDYYEELVK